MPSYDDVANRTVKDLISATDDKPQVAEDTDTLQSVAKKLAGSTAAAVLILDSSTRRIVALIGQSDLAQAVANKVGFDSKVSDIIGRRNSLVAINASTTLGQLPERLGTFSKIVVLDEHQQPTAVIDRGTLAQRVRGLA
jgi:hypothetical protein